MFRSVKLSMVLGLECVYDSYWFVLYGLKKGTEEFLSIGPISSSSILFFANRVVVEVLTPVEVLNLSFRRLRHLTADLSDVRS